MHVRLFKYSDSVVMISRCGSDCKLLKMKGESITVWEAFKQATRLDPEDFFSSKHPHSKNYLDVVIGSSNMSVTAAGPSLACTQFW